MAAGWDDWPSSPAQAGLFIMLQEAVCLGKKLGGKCYVLSLELLLFPFLNSGV